VLFCIGIKSFNLSQLDMNIFKFCLNGSGEKVFANSRNLSLSIFHEESALVTDVTASSRLEYWGHGGYITVDSTPYAAFIEFLV
jgi:hypothetical protein